MFQVYADVQEVQENCKLVTAFFSKTSVLNKQNKIPLCVLYTP